MVAYLTCNSVILEDILAAAQARALAASYWPRETVRCSGPAMFRTQAARDLACLIDVDPDVSAWVCLPLILRHGEAFHIPDFAMDRGDARVLSDSRTAPDWVRESAADSGYNYEVTETTQVALAVRLQNAKDLLRYAGYRVALSDTIRLLAFLEEHGPIPILSCLPLVQHSRDPMAVIARLFLDRNLHIGLDDGPIGPETRVHRIG